MDWLSERPPQEAALAYGLSFPLPPPVMLPPNSDDSGELTLGAGDGWTTGAGAAIAGRSAGFGFAGRGAAALRPAVFLAAFFLGADFLAAFFATFLAVFFLAAFLFGAALRRADFFVALRATFLRVTFDLALTRAFLDFAAFFFARFLDAFFAAIVSPLPLDRCVFGRTRFPDRAN
ncbi:MAG TPA: hypothetical protein VJ822_17220 [Dongiaceae bacterium]|nr:hypothetical protein [Dongiaceae bacterium]